MNWQTETHFITRTPDDVPVAFIWNGSAMIRILVNGTEVDVMTSYGPQGGPMDLAQARGLCEDYMADWYPDFSTCDTCGRRFPHEDPGPEHCGECGGCLKHCESNNCTRFQPI